MPKPTAESHNSLNRLSKSAYAYLIILISHCGPQLNLVTAINIGFYVFY